MGYVFSNPLMPPPVISEIYWDEDGWSMELFFNEVYEYTSLDQLALVCNDDTSTFLTGIPIIYNQPMVVTIDDLVNPIEIPIDSGFITIIEIVNYFSVDLGVYYGSHPNSHLTPTTFGQSIVRQQFYLDEFGEYVYWLVKETQPSMDSLPFSCRTRANFSGIVRDAFFDPVSGAKIKYIHTYSNESHYLPSIPEIITNEDGEFTTDQMFCKKYCVEVYVEGQEHLITTAIVEPDSLNYHEFLLDSFYVGINNREFTKPKIIFTANPNPVGSKLHIHLEINSINIVKSPALKLYDLNGSLIKSTIINSPYLNNIDIYWDELDNLNMPPGIYLLVLEGNGKYLCSRKLIFQ